MRSLIPISILVNIIGHYQRQIDWLEVSLWLAGIFLVLSMLAYFTKTGFPRKHSREDSASFYNTPDILQQSTEETGLYMTSGNFQGKTFGFRLLVWAFIIIMLFFPLLIIFDNTPFYYWY